LRLEIRALLAKGRAPEKLRSPTGTPTSGPDAFRSSGGGCPTSNDERRSAVAICPSRHGARGTDLWHVALCDCRSVAPLSLGAEGIERPRDRHPEGGQRPSLPRS